MKQINEIDFNESVKVEVESYRGWNSERPHQTKLNLTIGQVVINGLVEEDAEFLYQSLDRELHDETFENLEIKYQKSLHDNGIFIERIFELERQVNYLRNGKTSDGEELY